jgi:hypothetical protein
VRAGARATWALLTVVLCGAVVLARSEVSSASPSVAFGVNDDAWLLHGDGTLDARISELTRLGVDDVRFTVRWNEVATRRPADPRDYRDPAYDWRRVDAVLRGLRRHGIEPVITLYGTPEWANGGRSPNWAPTTESSFANFAHALARRYSWVRFWTIWNEPNRPSWLRPTSARIYVRRLLNPAYAQIHAVIAEARVGGGETAPRAGTGGVSPVAWIRAMGAAGARLDAYAHHPYPSRPQIETPWGPGCSRCSTITMADLERLLAEVRRSFGPVRIWLTEYGYQTNPPDTFLGVSPKTQAAYVASASLRAYLAPYVDLLVFFLVRDETADGGWQSGMVTANGVKKPAFTAFRLPLTQVFRRGALVGIWGQVRPRAGAQPFRLRLFQDGRWRWLGGLRWTDERGVFSLTLRAPAGARLQFSSPRDRAASIVLRLR